MKTESPAGAQSTLDVHRRLGGSMLVDDHSADDKHHMCELLDPDQARHTYSSTTVQHQHQQYPAPVHMHTHGGAYERPRWRPSGAVTAPTDGTPTAAAATPATVSTVYERLRAAYLPVLKQESVPSLRYEHGSASYLQYDEHTHARSERSEPHHDYHQHLHSQHLSSREAHSYENGQATVYSYTDRHDLQHQQSHERPAEAEAVTYRHSQYDQYDVSPAPVSASAPAVEYRPRPRWSARSTLTAIDALDEHRTLVPASAPVPAYAALSHPPPHANAYAPQDHRWPAEQYASNSQAPPVHVLPVSASYAPPTSTDRLSHHQHYHHASSPSAPVSHGENIPSSLLKPVPQYHERAPSPQQQRHERTRSPPPQRHERTRSPPPQRHERTRSPPTQRHERSRSPPTQHREQASSLSRYEDSNSHYQQRTRSPPRRYSRAAENTDGARYNSRSRDNGHAVVRRERSRSPVPLKSRHDTAVVDRKPSLHQTTSNLSARRFSSRDAKASDAEVDAVRTAARPSSPSPLPELTPAIYDDKDLYSEVRHAVYMLVPSDVFGCIVGPRGSIVLGISAQSQCTLTMCEADALALEGSFRVLNIYGKPRGICLAQRLVIERIRANRAKKRYALYTPITLHSSDVLRPLPNDGDAASQQQNRQSFAVPWRAAGALIGHRGSVAQQVTKQCGARLEMSPTSDQPLGSLNKTLHIHGTAQQVEDAYMIVRSLLRNALTNKTAGRKTYDPYDVDVVLKLVVSMRIMKLLLDDRGRLIHEITATSGAFAHFLPSRHEEARVCVITGSLECALRAQRVLLQLIVKNVIATGRGTSSSVPDDLQGFDFPLTTITHRTKAGQAVVRNDTARGKDAGSRCDRHTRTHTDAAQRGRVRERDPSSRGDRDWRRSASSDDRRVRVVSREDNRNSTRVIEAAPIPTLSDEQASARPQDKPAIKSEPESCKRSASGDGGDGGGDCNPLPNIIDRLGAPLMSARPSNGVKKQRR